MTAAERAAAVDGVEGRRRHEVYLRWEPAARNMRWEADHKELPVQVTPPRGTRPVKPWVTLFLDCYSRLIMGWALSLRPDSAMVLAAMRRGLVIDPERGPFGGIPQSLVPDGGREFDARHGAAVLQRHTIDATSTAEVLTRVRAVQAGFFTAGVFLQLPPRPGLPTTRVNFAPRLGPAGVERIRGLCSPAASAVLAIAATTGLRAGALRSIRLRDVHDTGPDQHVVAGGALYRVPGCVAGLIRAALIERHAQLAGEPATAAGCGPGGAGLFTGRDPETAVSERSLQQVLDRAAAYAGVTVSPPSFPGVAVHDLRGTA